MKFIKSLRQEVWPMWSIIGLLIDWLNNIYLSFSDRTHQPIIIVYCRRSAIGRWSNSTRGYPIETVQYRITKLLYHPSSAAVTHLRICSTLIAQPKLYAKLFGLEQNKSRTRIRRMRYAPLRYNTELQRRTRLRVSVEDPSGIRFTAVSFEHSHRLFLLSISTDRILVRGRVVEWRLERPSPITETTCDRRRRPNSRATSRTYKRTTRRLHDTPSGHIAGRQYRSDCLPIFQLR